MSERFSAFPFIVLGGAGSIWAEVTWRARERALRAGRPLPSTPFGPVLSVGVGLGAVVAIALTLLG